MAGALAVFYPAKLVGRHEARQAVEIEAAKEALDRINHLEKNNAEFRSKSGRDRCLVLMRDSGLPDSACN